MPGRCQTQEIGATGYYGIGPKADRPSMVNTHWGDVEENNHFGTHEFLHLCELLNTEPYISGNVGSGTVEEMSQWVEYLTRTGDSPMVRLRRQNGREAPWRVKFWGLGNETWGCGGHMRREFYPDLARQYGTYCRDHGANKLYRIASGANVDDYAWTEALMKTIGDLGGGSPAHHYFQAVSLHHYTFAGDWNHKRSATDFNVDEYYQTMLNAQRMDELITRHSTVMDCYDPDRRIGLVVDEWGTWYEVEPGTNPGFLYQQNTLRDALVASLHFDIFHRHAERVVMANIAQTVNVLQAMILTDGEQMILTPTYHVFEMNKAHHDAASLDVHLTSPGASRKIGDQTLQTLSMTASTKDGRALISITNLDADAAQSVQIDLRGAEFDVGPARILNAAQLQNVNSVEQPQAVSPQTFDAVNRSGQTLSVEIPAHSFVTVELD